MSYKILATAAPGRYLDGRVRPPLGINGKPTLPPNTEVCLVEATDETSGYHHKGDRWVEHFEIR